MAIVGLGSGALAAYGRAGDTFTYYEIDPAVARIASDPTLFSYLSDSAADTDIVLGDGRLSLERTDEIYDVMVLDAFSSDAIPVHLLTAQAVQEYLRHLRADGVLAIHISNRYFDLRARRQPPGRDLRPCVGGPPRRPLARAGGGRPLVLDVGRPRP